MAQRISPLRLNHMNLVVEGFDASVSHFNELYGAEFVTDLPSPEFHAGLVAFGGGIFELFAPNAWLLSARFGPFHLGVEYQADVDEVREVLASQDIRIIRDIGKAVHTHPDDTLGVSFEFYGLHFTQKEWPLLGRPILPPSYWRDEHPLGMTGIKGYSIAVECLDAGVEWLSNFFIGDVVEEEFRSAAGERMVGLQVSDSLVEVVAPEGTGELERFLSRYGPGIRSTVFGVQDISRARAYFEERGIKLAPGSNERRFTIPAAANAGAIFEIEAD